MGEALLEVRGLRKEFVTRDRGGKSRRQVVRAVDGIDLSIHRGETLGLVGESGCGKSTTGRLLTRLLDPTDGSIELEGRDIASLRGRELKAMRRRVQMVFQDPYSSLDPRMRVRDIIAEPLQIHGSFEEEGGDRRIDELLELVGLDASHRTRSPRAFSGGQRQRIGIARALALRPDILVLDEPVSALDVSIQAQVINLLQSLQAELGVAYILIAHDLAVVRHISHRIGVMYLGKIVETGDSDTVYDTPAHPYTASLLSAVPNPDLKSGAKRQRIVLRGELPSPANPPSGCRFRTRCWLAEEKCAQEEPPLERARDGQALAACFFPLRAESVDVDERGVT